MTDDQLRELDGLVAEHIFCLRMVGWYREWLVPNEGHERSFGFYTRDHHYSWYPENPEHLKRFRILGEAYVCSDVKRLMYWDAGQAYNVPHYSSEWEDALFLLDDESSPFRVMRHLSSRSGYDYVLRKTHPDGRFSLVYMTPSGERDGPVAETGPLAIVLAALQSCSVTLPVGFDEGG